MAIRLSLQELARRIGGTILRGDASSSFSGIDALDSATPEDISFLGNEKYHSLFLTTKAGAVIVPSGHDFGDHPAALVAVPNPSLSFAAVVRHFAAARKHFSPGIHPTAFVSKTATLDPAKVSVRQGAVIMDHATVGNGSEIGPNSVIGEETIIGADCLLAANVTVNDRSVIGSRVIIHSGSVVGSDGYGYEFHDGRHLKIDQVGIVEIGDDVEIGSNTSIDRARFGKTRVGDGTKIDNLVQIGHNVTIGKHCLIVAQSGLAGSCTIGDHVTVAAQSGIGGHVTVGSHTTLAGRSGVTTDLPGGAIYSGKPAIPIKQDTKLQAHVRRLPKILIRLKALEKHLREP